MDLSEGFRLLTRHAPWFAGVQLINCRQDEVDMF